MGSLSSNGGRRPAPQQVSWFDQQPEIQQRPTPTPGYDPNGRLPADFAAWQAAQPPPSGVSRGTPGPINTTMSVPAPQGGSVSAPVSGQPIATVPPPNQGGSVGTQPYSDAAMLAIIHKYPPTNEGARAADAEIQRTFGAAAPQLMEHPLRLDKWQFSDGRVYDAMIGAGAPGASWVTRLAPEHAGGGGSGAPGAVGGSAGTAAPGSIGSLARGGYSPANSEGYQFVLGEGIKALDRSASAKGTLRGGGQMKAIMRYGAGLASGEFDKDFGRNYQLASLGLNATNNAANLGSSYSGQVGNLAGNYGNQTGSLAGNQSGDLNGLTADQINNLGNLITGQGNANASGTIGSANAWRGTLADLIKLIPAQQQVNQ